MRYPLMVETRRATTASLDWPGRSSAVGSVHVGLLRRGSPRAEVL